jgi:hypothetical protein
MFSQWPDPAPYHDPLQTEISFFWPLTEQVSLDLDYIGCDTRQIISTAFGNYCVNATGPNWTTVSTNITNIAPTLSVQPQNSVGQLSIGGVQIGLEKQPKWYQRVLYKLLGFNWKNGK